MSSQALYVLKLTLKPNHFFPFQSVAGPPGRRGACAQPSASKYAGDSVELKIWSSTTKPWWSTINSWPPWWTIVRNGMVVQEEEAASQAPAVDSAAPGRTFSPSYAVVVNAKLMKQVGVPLSPHFFPFLSGFNNLFGSEGRGVKSVDSVNFHPQRHQFSHWNVKCSFNLRTHSWSSSIGLVIDIHDAKKYQYSFIESGFVRTRGRSVVLYWSRQWRVTGGLDTGPWNRTFEALWRVLCYFSVRMIVNDFASKIKRKSTLKILIGDPPITA